MESLENSIIQLMDECEDEDDALQYAEELAREFDMRVEDVEEKIKAAYNTD